MHNEHEEEKDLDSSGEVQYNTDSTDSEIIPDEAPAALLKRLRDELKKAQAERGEYLAGWQRTKADFINLRKRDEEEKQQFATFAAGKFAEDLLPTLDGFEQAIAHKESNDTWRSGIEQIHQHLDSVLKKNGLEKFGTVGDAYNPEFHEGVATMPAINGEKEETVAEVLQAGYKFKGRVLRPARVKVFG